MKLHEITQMVGEKGVYSLTAVDQRLLAKLNLTERPANGPRQNPISGEVVELSDSAALIYDWLTAWYREYSRLEAPPEGFPTQTYDRVKYFFLKLWPTAYMALID